MRATLRPWSAHRRVLLIAVLLVGLGGCTGRSASPSASPADVIFVDGTVITMDDRMPSAQAVAVAGQKIVAVGRDDDVARWRGPATIVVDLQGHTLVPGFIDAHEYRVQKYADGGYPDPAAAVDAAVRQGWTTLDELYVDPTVMATLQDLDRAGRLRTWVNAYLPVMQYDAAGTTLGPWYQAYHQGQRLSPHVRVAGVIAFTDYDNATVLLWHQDALDSFVLTAARQGWSVAFKTVSTRSLEMILQAQEYVARVDPDAATRTRLEHALFVTADQISRIKALGLVPVINLNNPGQLVGESDVDQLVTREPTGAYAPWRSMEQAGIVVADGTGWPSYYVNEPSGAPFGSPMHLLYQAVTRTGNLGRQPYPWLLDQTITANQALRALTIGSAYAAAEEGTKGSITAGKLADLAILSGDPLTVPTAQINDIDVLLTMIGGQVQWCAPAARGLCPGPNTTAGGATTPGPVASSPGPATPADAFLGTWSAADPTDGSAMSLRVTRHASGYQVVLTDTRASRCGIGTGGVPNTAARIEATGDAHGEVLGTVATSITCLTEPPTSTPVQLHIDYRYDPGTDTLTDTAQHATWRRQHDSP